MATDNHQLRRRLVEFLIKSSEQLEVPPIVKYSALAFFADRFQSSVTRFLQRTKAEHWLLKPLAESNLQLFALITIWISSKIHDSRYLTMKVLKSLGDKTITEQHFMVRDFLEAELIFLQVLKYEICTSNIPFVHMEELYIRFKQVAKVGELLSFEACMDLMDLLYEKEETSDFHRSPHCLSTSILVCSYIITVPKQHCEFPILPWVKFVTACREEEVLELVRDILNHVL